MQRLPSLRGLLRAEQRLWVLMWLLWGRTLVLQLPDAETTAAPAVHRMA